MVGRAGLTRDLLIGAFEEAGASEVVSFLTTGNLIFESDSLSTSTIVGSVTEILRAKIGWEEPIFVRAMAHLAALATSRPFDSAPTDAIYEQCVTFLPRDLPEIGTLPIRSPRGDVEIFERIGGEAFSITRMIGGRTGYAGSLIERQSGCRVTTRNWNTILRILDKYT